MHIDIQEEKMGDVIESLEWCIESMNKLVGKLERFLVDEKHKAAAWQDVRDAVSGMLPEITSWAEECLEDESKANLIHVLQTLANSLAVEVGDRVEVEYQGDDERDVKGQEKGFWAGKVTGVQGLTTRGNFQVVYPTFPDEYEENLKESRPRRLPPLPIASSSQRMSLQPPPHLARAATLQTAVGAAKRAEFVLMTMQRVLSTEMHAWREEAWRLPTVLHILASDLARALWEVRGRAAGRWPALDLEAGQVVLVGGGRSRQAAAEYLVGEVDADKRVVELLRVGSEWQRERVEFADLGGRVVLRDWPGLQGAAPAGQLEEVTEALDGQGGVGPQRGARETWTSAGWAGPGARSAGGALPRRGQGWRRGKEGAGSGWKG